ncbi:MAG: sugar phosphate isomerase/epimerase [Gordonia sp. (in: high G+C Gram-positive bacteria)]
MLDTRPAPDEDAAAETEDNGRRFAVDLITFADPTSWGCVDSDAFARWAATHRAQLWAQIFATAEATGVTGLEMTFEPFGRDSALAWLGSDTRFAQELQNRGISLVSSYLVGTERVDAYERAPRRNILEQARRLAEFTRICGSDIIVCGLPPRRAEVVSDSDRAGAADLLGELIETAARVGCRVALHTESHSQCWSIDDLDTILASPGLADLWVCPDLAHLHLAGDDPAAACARFIDRIALVHWKDAVGTLPMRPPSDPAAHVLAQAFRPLGDGEVDLRAVRGVLARAGLLDMILIEVDAAPDPTAAIAKSIAALVPILS